VLSLLLTMPLLALGSGCSKSKSDGPGQTRVDVAAGSASVASSSSEPLVKITIPAGFRLVSADDLLEYVRLTPKKGVVLNAWASWCGPCRAEMPLLLELSQQYPDLDFLFVTVDDIDKLAPVAERMKELKLPRPSFVARPPLEEFKAALSPRWKGSLPATFLFDPSGKLRYWWGTEVFEQELRPILDGFLAGKDIDGEANFKVRRQPPQPPAAPAP
jgi:thiol-disulfide isomerase/thioredoxin